MKRRITALILILCLALTACAKSDGSKQNTAGDTDITNAADSSATLTQEPVVTEEPKAPYEGNALNFDTSVTYQTMDGFGAAYTWYGDRLLNAKNSEEGLDALFSDAKLTILRFKNEYEYTMDGKANNALTMAKNYKEARERAAEYGETVQVLLSCWAPPAKLKSDGTIGNGYGTLKKNDEGGYAYDEYATWWADSVEFYRSKGVQIDYVSLQNEVDFSPEDYEGCRFAAKENDTYAGYDKAFCAVYDEFQKRFGEDAPKLLGPETMSCNAGTLMTYANAIKAINPDALDGLAYHLYVGGDSDSSTMTVKPSSYMVNFWNIKSTFPDMRKWETEFYIGHGLQTSELIWSALVNADMTAYLYWSGVWDDSTPNNFESADLVEINNKGEWRLSANYYAMRHFSEFIRPGYVRIDTKDEEPQTRSCAFANENNTKIAIVVVNTTDKDFDYQIKGSDYTILDSAIYRSEFGEGDALPENMYKSVGSLDDEGVFHIAPYSVTTIDITGYVGDTKAEVPEIQKIVYTDEVITEADQNAVPEEDVVLLDDDFSDADQTKAYSGFGSSICRQIADGGEDGQGGMIVKGRADTWNGMTLSTGYFEHYGYMVKVSYDCMMEEDGRSVSCTSTFTTDEGTFYPDGENNRVAVFDMEGGKWYHAEGYVTMYSNMKDESFRIYWESADNTDDFYLDNIKVEIMYTMPAGEYTAE